MIRNVSQLARIEMSDAELEAYTAQLGKILEYFDTLSDLDTASVDPAVHAVDLHAPVRADETTPSLPRDRVMSNTMHSREGFYVVPKVME